MLFKQEHETRRGQEKFLKALMIYELFEKIKFEADCIIQDLETGQMYQNVEISVKGNEATSSLNIESFLRLDL
jgi:hypothetical protein